MSPTKMAAAIARPGAGGGGFESFGTLQGWWAADALVGLSDGDPVTTWPDGAAANHDATAVGAVKPVYKTNIINGLPVVRFTRSQAHYFDCGFSVAALPVSVFVVYNKQGSNWHRPLAGGGNTWLGNTGVGLTFHDVVAGPTANGWYVLAGVRRNTTPKTRLWNGDTQIGNNETTTTWGAVYLGGMQTTDVLQGDIAEALIYSTEVSDVDRAAIIDALQSKWGL